MMQFYSRKLGMRVPEVLGALCHDEFYPTLDLSNKNVYDDGLK